MLISLINVLVSTVWLRPLMMRWCEGKFLSCVPLRGSRLCCYNPVVVNPRATDKQQRNRQKPLSAHTDIYCLPGSSQVLGLSCGEGQVS